MQRGDRYGAYHRRARHDARSNDRQGDRRAIDSYPDNLKVLVVGTGGLSHQLDGPRAGFINKEFDQFCMNELVHNPDSLTRYSIPELVEQAGAQGVELLNWVAMRGALTGTVTEAHHNYHIPISNTATATMVFANRCRRAARRLNANSRRIET